MVSHRALHVTFAVAAILDYFTNLDNEEKSKVAPLAPLPAKVSGIAGGLAGDLYREAVAAGNFGTVLEELHVSCSVTAFCLWVWFCTQRRRDSGCAV